MNNNLRIPTLTNMVLILTYIRISMGTYMHLDLHTNYNPFIMLICLILYKTQRHTYVHASLMYRHYTTTLHSAVYSIGPLVHFEIYKCTLSTSA